MRNNGKKKPCRFLSFYGKIAFCRVYRTRIGHYCGYLEGKKFVCTESKEFGFKYLNPDRK